MSKINFKQVLVTGAGGFIGSHLTERLVEEGVKVRALAHYNSRNDWGLLELVPRNVLKEVEVVTGDVQDPFSIRKFVEGCEVVFHLASLIAIPFSYIAPQAYVATNVMGTLNVMQACLEEGVSKVVHTSTSETYGTARYVPIDENHPLHAQSPYSASKIGADKIAESYFLSFDLPVAIIRPFNTYGPRQSARAVIPTIISQALHSDQLILGSTHPTRDLNYVSDTVNAFLKTAVSDESIGEIINIGSGKEISIRQLAEKILRIIGKNAYIQTDEQRVRPPKSEVNRLLADISKSEKLLGWKPEVSLDQGLQATIEWISENESFYKTYIYNL